MSVFADNMMVVKNKTIRRKDRMKKLLALLLACAMVLFYNTNLLTADAAPADWSDLAKAEYAKMIVTRDTLSSSMGSTVA